MTNFLSLNEQEFIVCLSNGMLAIGSSEANHAIKKYFQVNTKAISAIAKNESSSKILIGSEDGLRRLR